MHFTGAFATVLILRIGLPDSAKPYGYMRLFLRPTVPRVCATAVCPGVRSSQNAPSLDPLSYPSDHYLRLRSIRRAVPFSVTLRLHCIFRRLPCACAYTPAWSPEARAGRTFYTYLTLGTVSCIVREKVSARLCEVLQ